MAYDPLPGLPKQKRNPRDFTGIGLPPREPWVRPEVAPPPKPVSATVGKVKVTRKEFDGMSPLRRHEVATSGRFEIVD